MDPEKVKTSATTTLTTATTTVTASSVKSSTKVQLRHQEHNYTNTMKTGESYHRDESSVSKTTSSTTMTTAPSSSTSSSTTIVASSSDSTAESHSQSQPRAGYSGTRSGGVGLPSPHQSVQPTSNLLGDRLAYDVRSGLIRKDAFNRTRRSEEELQKAAEMVRGGMTFQTASDTFKIPISTIRFYMARRGILPQRRRGRGSSGARDDDLIHPPFEIVHYRLPDIDRPF